MRVNAQALRILKAEITDCRICPRLVEHRERIAQEKRRAFRDWSYWAKPVPGFGDPAAQLLIVGLAPAAHGANRTGRMFTGDRSGDFLFRALFETGFASQPEAISADDGLNLRDAYVVSAVRCAPPGNKPSLNEIRACRPYLAREIDLMRNVKVVVALGHLAFNVYLGLLRDRGQIVSRSAFRFAHNATHRTRADLPLLISSFHPSQQNTSTGRLTLEMLTNVFEGARKIIHAVSG